MDEKTLSLPSAAGMEKRIEELQRMATRDALSGLMNRDTLERCIKERLAAMTAEETCALFIVDLDDFKRVNDTLGHQAGFPVRRGRPGYRPAPQPGGKGTHMAQIVLHGARTALRPPQVCGEDLDISSTDLIFFHDKSAPNVGMGLFYRADPYSDGKTRDGPDFRHAYGKQGCDAYLRGELSEGLSGTGSSPYCCLSGRTFSPFRGEGSCRCCQKKKTVS